MTPQSEATLVLLNWQKQREARVPAEQRKIEDHEFQRIYERDLSVLRKVMERA